MHAALLALLLSAHGLAQDAWGIALKTDPAFALDGNLAEWGTIPNALSFDRVEQVVHGPGSWTDAADLSGRAWVAWRDSHLYVAVDVVDDRVAQSQRGDGIWQGDHVEVFLDAAPDLQPDRDPFGEGQFQLALSPGNFLRTGDALVDCLPEAFVYRPRGTALTGIEVASQRTERGWSLEAGIPWRLLGVERPTVGTLLRVEVALSDTDSPDPRQESFMTSLTDSWAHVRSRLRLAALAGTDGKAPPVVTRFALREAAEIKAGDSERVTFEAPETPPGRDALLTLRARLHFQSVAGHTYALKLALNGQPLDAERLVSRPRQLRARSGDVFPSGSAGGFRTFYAPDFDSPDRDQHYGLVDGVKACLFELRVTDLVRVGTNELEIADAAPPEITAPLVVANVGLEFRRPPPPEREKAGPPTGPLPVIEPRAAHRTDFRAEALEGGGVRVTVDGATFTVQSRFSTPKPGWVTGGCEYFTHERRLEVGPEAARVWDTFTNLTDAPLALMQRHEATTEGGLKRVWIAGLEKLDGRGQDSEASNPTSYGATETVGLGLLAVGDVGRVHATNYALDGKIGLADNQCVLGPRASYTAEWALIPTDEADHWAFLNAARRLMGANFLIDGGFAFLRHAPLTPEWSDRQTEDFIRLKDARYVCASITFPLYNGLYPHGTAFQTIAHESFRQAFERRRRLVPEALNLVYFHCFIDVREGAPELYADSRLLRPDGRQGDYGKPDLRIFFPTERNSYGRAIGKNVDIILEDIGAEGVYWDEHEYSAYEFHYGEPWDGFSGDVDPTTFQVVRLKSSVTLLTEPWRLDLAQRILSRGALIGNGAPVTRRMMDLRFPCFVETGTITHCRRAQLYSPVALGDHLTERSERDAYRQMLAALDYGCVYHWYDDVTVMPTHHHLTRYMFPITPRELHEGYLIGEERIVTNRSGLFGWGDASAHEVHVFNADGVEVDGFSAPQVTRDGKTYTELRIAEDWSAAIVRKGR